MADVNSISISPRALKANNKGKKRKVNTDKWKNNIRKVLRNSGKAYTTSTGAKVERKSHPIEVSGRMLYINNECCSCLVFVCLFVFVEAS